MRFIQAGIILLLGFWVFSPAIQGEWLFDDIPGVLYNSTLHTSRGLWAIWFAPRGADFFPLKDTVQWLQWHLWGKSVPGYHLTNVALHLASALLVWRLLGRLGVRLAWLGGLLFAIHPVAVESVAWMSELKNTLSLPFLLMAMLAYLHYDTHGDRISYLRSVAAFLAALLSKTSVVMFPVVILLHAWWRHGRIRRVDVKGSAVFFGLSLVLGSVTMLFQHNLPPGSDPIEVPDPISRLLCAGLMTVFYLSKFFWPAHLTVVYFRWDIPAATPWEIFSWALLLLSLGWLGTRRQPWSRHALFGFLFFLINLVPVLGFTGTIWMRYAWVADHFLYLPMIGLVGLVAAGAGNLYDRYVPARRYLAVAAAVIVAALAVQSHAHAQLFGKSLLLWRQNLRENPASWLGYNNLAVALAADGEPVEAIRQLQRGLWVRPAEGLSYFNWGNALLQMGHVPDALKAYRMALALRPDNALFHNQMGNVLVQAGQWDQGMEQYRLALQVNADDVQAHSNLADVFIQTGRMTEAIEQARQAIHLDPDYSNAHDNLGIALGRTGRIPEATDEFAIAASLSPDDPEIQYNWGVALLRQGDSAEALKHFRRASQLDPRYGRKTTR